ncbi:MAG: transcription elongation factor GreA [Myxococcales bacterium]|nr:transcription elongation factor GreA [Myxococcales bacterium]
MAKNPVTVEGFRALQERLKQLKEIERPANVRAIEEARAHGDLSENAEYAAAKERQSFIAGEITQVETLIATAEVIDPTTLGGERVVFGATVSLFDLDKDEEMQYKIVGVSEVDLKQNKISYESPIARAIIGKQIGDEVQVRTPGGLRNYEITDVVFR